MTSVIIRVEDDGRGEHASLLEGAKTTQLQHLSQAGAAGALGRKTKDALDRLDVHRGLLGVAADDAAAQPARWYAAERNIRLEPEAAAWCCELITLSDGKVMDATAGRIRTRESEELIAALNDQLGSDQRRWHLGEGSHHLLVTTDQRLAGTDRLRSPEQLTGHPWKQNFPRGAQREPLRKLLEEAAKILESHPVNRVRVDLGENPANAIWLWGPAGGGAAPAQRNGAIISGAFPLAGAALVLGMASVRAAAPVDEGDFTALADETLRLGQQHPLVYLHVPVTAEQPVDRLVAMERLDQLVVRRLTETQKDLRLLVVVDERPATSAAFVAYGRGVAQHPVSKLTGDGLAGGLAFEDPMDVHQWFTR